MSLQYTLRQYVLKNPMQYTLRQYTLRQYTLGVMQYVLESMTVYRKRCLRGSSFVQRAKAGVKALLQSEAEKRGKSVTKLIMTALREYLKNNPV